MVTYTQTSVIQTRVRGLDTTHQGHLRGLMYAAVESERPVRWNIMKGGRVERRVRWGYIPCDKNTGKSLGWDDE